MVRTGTTTPLERVSSLASWRSFAIHILQGVYAGRGRHFWLLLLLGHSLGEQPLGFLGTVLAFPRNLPQECCQFFILTHGSGTEQGLLSSIGKRLWYLW